MKEAKRKMLQRVGKHDANWGRKSSKGYWNGHRCNCKRDREEQWGKTCSHAEETISEQDWRFKEEGYMRGCVQSRRRQGDDSCTRAAGRKPPTLQRKHDISNQRQTCTMPPAFRARCRCYSGLSLTWGSLETIHSNLWNDKWPVYGGLHWIHTTTNVICEACLLTCLWPLLCEKAYWPHIIQYTKCPHSVSYHSLLEGACTECVPLVERSQLIGCQGPFQKLCPDGDRGVWCQPDFAFQDSELEREDEWESISFDRIEPKDP